MGRDWSSELVGCIKGADRVAANALLTDWAETRSYEEAVTELLTPALELFGGLWADQGGETSLAQGYVAAKIAEDLLGRILVVREAEGRSLEAKHGPVVIGNVEDDYHPLGRNMLVAFLRSAGWEVYDLGVDVPPEVFLDKVQEVGARVLGASAMMFSTARNVAGIRQEIDRRGLTGRVQLAVGGPCSSCGRSSSRPSGGMARRPRRSTPRRSSSSSGSAPWPCTRQPTRRPVMNSLERVFATVGGQPKDRPAFVLNLSLYGSKLAGHPLQTHYSTASAYAEGQMAVREVFGPDLLLSPFLVPALGEAFGSEVTAYRQQVPNIRRYAAASAAEALKLPLPDIDGQPRLVFLRETIRLLAARYQGEVPVVGVLVSPLDLPPLVIGVEAWLEALLSEPDTARALLERWTPFCVDLANAMLGDGATLVALTANFANPTLVPPRVVQGLARPVLEAALGAIQGPIILHHGGAVLAPHLAGYLGLPNVAAYFVDARDSLAQARQALGDAGVLIGNLHAPALEDETPESVRTQCEAILADRVGDPRFLFGSSGADIPLATPPEVIQAVVDTLCQAGAGAL